MKNRKIVLFSHKIYIIILYNKNVNNILSEKHHESGENEILEEDMNISFKWY